MMLRANPPSRLGALRLHPRMVIKRLTARVENPKSQRFGYPPMSLIRLGASRSSLFKVPDGIESAQFVKIQDEEYNPTENLSRRPRYLP